MAWHGVLRSKSPNEIGIGIGCLAANAVIEVGDDGVNGLSKLIKLIKLIKLNDDGMCEA